MISLDSITNSLEETVMRLNKKAKVIYVNKTGEELSGRLLKTSGGAAW